MTEPIKFEFMTRRYALMVMRLNPTTDEPMGKPMYATPGDVEAAQASLQLRPGAPSRVTCTCGAGSDEDCGGPSDHVPPCPASKAAK